MATEITYAELKKRLGIPDLIYRQALRANVIKFLNAQHGISEFAFDNCFPYWIFAKEIASAPAVDAVEVVRCKDCKYGIWNEEEGLWMCVFTADYDEELGMYHGFVQYNTADYYCADGERREDK